MSGVLPETSSERESFIKKEINKLQKAIDEINGVIKKQSSEGNEKHETIEDIVELINNGSETSQAEANKVTLGCLLVCKKQIDEKKTKLEKDQTMFTSIPCSELNNNKDYYECVKSLEEGEAALLESNSKLLTFKEEYNSLAGKHNWKKKIDINFNFNDILTDDEKFQLETTTKCIDTYEPVINCLIKDQLVLNEIIKLVTSINVTKTEHVESLTSSWNELQIKAKDRRAATQLNLTIGKKLKNLINKLINNKPFENNIETAIKSLGSLGKSKSALGDIISTINTQISTISTIFEMFKTFLFLVAIASSEDVVPNNTELENKIEDSKKKLKNDTTELCLKSLEEIENIRKSCIEPTECINELQNGVEGWENNEVFNFYSGQLDTDQKAYINRLINNRRISNEITKLLPCIKTIKEKELPMSMWILINGTMSIITDITGLKRGCTKLQNDKLEGNVAKLGESIELEKAIEGSKIKDSKQKLNSLRWASEPFKPFLGREKSIEVFNKYKEAFFFGEDEDQFLNKNKEGGGFKPLAAIGIPGAGKTTFIKNMSAEVNEEEFISVVVTYSEPVELSNDKDEQIKQFTTQLLSSNGISDETAQSPPSLVEIIEQLFDLKKYENRKGMIIFVDDLIPHDDGQKGNVQSQYVQSLISALMTIQDDSRKNSNKRVMFVFTGLDSDYLTTDGSISSIPLYNLSPENSILAIADEKMNKEMKEKIKEMKEKTKEEIEGMNKKMKEKIKEMKEKTKEEIEGMNKKMKEKMNKEMKEKIKEMNEEMNKKIKEINKKMKKKMNKEIKEINKKMNAEMKKKMKVIRESKSLWQSFLSCGGNPGLLSLLDTNDSESVFSYKIKESYSRVKLNIINNFLNYENVCRWFTGSVSGDDLELWKEKGLIQDADGLQYLVPQLLRLWANDDNNDDINGNNNLIKLLKNHLRDAYEGDVLCVPGQEKNMETVTMNFECIRKILLVNKEVVTVKDFFAGAMFSDEKFEKEKLKIIIPESEKTSLVKFAENLGQSEDVDSSKTETENSSKTRQKNKGYNGKHDKKILNYLKDGYTVASEKQNEKGVERIVPFYCGDDLLVALMQDKFVSTTDYWSAAKDNILKSPCVEFLKRKGIQYFVVFNTTFYEHEDISSWGEGGIGHKPIGCVHFTGTALVESTSRFGPLKLNCAKLKVTVKGKTEYSPVKKVYPHLHKDYNGL